MEEVKVPTQALVKIEEILNEFDEDARVAMLRYLLDIAELTLEKL